MRSHNIFSPTLTPNPDEPARYRASDDRLGPKIGAAKMGATLYELTPGTGVCPYHYESTEEWLLVLEGEVTLRHPDGEDILTAGDMTAFPAGPAGAHQTTNRGSATARLIMFSVEEPIGFCAYPDSDKISFWSDSPDDRDRVRVRRGENLDYYDGEPLDERD